MIKQSEKGIAIAMILAAGAATIFLGFQGWRAYLVPLQYIGFVLVAVGVAGLVGVNIWVGPFAIDPEEQKKGDDDPTSRPTDADERGP